MGNYMAYPTCMNTAEGENIYRCTDCSAIFCESCDVKTGLFGGGTGKPGGVRCGTI